MSFRSFLFGMVFGAVATAAVFIARAPDPAAAYGLAPPPAPAMAQMAAPPETPPSAAAPTAASRPAPPASIEFRPVQPPLRIGGDPRPPGKPPAAAPGPGGATIPLSAEHARLLAPPPDEKRPPTLAELHMQISSEGRDPAWAPELEQAIRQALTAGNTTGEFELMNVECRATLCEVLAFGNQPGSGQRWNQLMEEMTRQPWWSTGNLKGDTTSSYVRNNRSVIITLLHRGKQR